MRYGTPDPVSTGRTKVVLIVGAGRSGTTLFGNTLGSLPGTLSAGEIKLALGRGVAEAGGCGCRRSVLSCPVWVPALEETFGRIPSRAVAAAFDQRLDGLVRTRRLLSWMKGRREDAAVAEFVDVLGRLITNLAVAAGAEAVIDSSKNPGYGALLSLSPLLDVRIVHVVRDPHAVAWSWQRESASHQVGGYEERMEQFAGPTSALIWLSANTAVEMLAHSGRQPITRVHYEDFIADPRGAVAEVARFADLTPDLSFIGSDGLHLATTHTVAGNPNRVRVGPVRLRADDEWRTQMPARSRRIVSMLTLPQRARLGY